MTTSLSEKCCPCSSFFIYPFRGDDDDDDDDDLIGRPLC